MKTRLSARDIRALVLALCVVLAAILIRYALLPLAVAWLQQETQIRDERELYARERHVVANKSANEADRRATSGQLFAGYARVFRSGHPNLAAAGALAYVDSLAQESRIQVQHSSARAAAPAGGTLVGMMIDFSGASDFEGVMAFLRALETGPMLVHIPAFGLEAPTSDQSMGQPQTMLLKATIEMYFAKEPPVGAKASS